MRHPDEWQLQAYHDGELPGALAQQVQEHLHQCSACAAELHEWEALSHLVRSQLAAAPFSAAGEFWVQLAARLPEARPSVWPLVSYLPPFLLGAFGLLAEGLMSLVLLVYAFIRAGWMPSLSSALRAWLTQRLAAPFWAGSLYARLGWTSEEVVQAVVKSLEALSPATPEAIVMLVGVFVLGLFSSVMVILYISWALCWSEAARSSL